MNDLSYQRIHFNLGRFNTRCKVHLRRWLLAYLLLLAAAAWFQTHYAIGLNASPSLPHRLFLIHKETLPDRGDYVAFRWRGGGPYAAGTIFVKRLAGMPGDVVSRTGRDFQVNGMPAGHAKVKARDGSPLEPGPTGTLPPGYYYVESPHEDSLDSRYQLTGWISRSQIIGRAYALF